MFNLVPCYSFCVGKWLITNYMEQESHEILIVLLFYFLFDVNETRHRSVPLIYHEAAPTIYPPWNVLGLHMYTVAIHLHVYCLYCFWVSDWPGWTIAVVFHRPQLTQAFQQCGSFIFLYCSDFIGLMFLLLDGMHDTCGKSRKVLSSSL